MNDYTMMYLPKNDEISSSCTKKPYLKFGLNIFRKTSTNDEKQGIKLFVTIDVSIFYAEISFIEHLLKGN